MNTSTLLKRTSAVIGILLCLTRCGDPADIPTDGTTPTIGTELVFSSISSSGITVTWGAATDDVTLQANLRYKLVVSFSDNIATVENAEANGSTLLDWTANSFTFSATDLSEAVNYYFNVLVKDGAGNKTVYTSNSQATLLSCAGTIVAGYCWYLATGGNSCTTTCAAHAGTHAATINYVGSPNAGDQANAANCGTVVTALSEDLTTSTPFVITLGYSAVPGVGCIHDDQHLFLGGLIRPAIHTIEATTQAAASQSHLRRVCACEE